MPPHILSLGVSARGHAAGIPAEVIQCRPAPLDGRDTFGLHQRPLIDISELSRAFGELFKGSQIAISASRSLQFSQKGFECRRRMSSRNLRHLATRGRRTPGHLRPTFEDCRFAPARAAFTVRYPVVRRCQHKRRTPGCRRYDGARVSIHHTHGKRWPVDA